MVSDFGLDFRRYLISSRLEMEFLTDHTVVMPILVVAFHFLTAAGVWFYHRISCRHRPQDFQKGNFKREKLLLKEKKH